MLGIVKEIDGQKKIIPLTTDTGTGAPVGTLITQYKKVPMSGYLYCDGSRFDENVYPTLYMYLGKNELPDYSNNVENGYVYIKATSGLAENQQDNVLNNVKDYVDNSNSYSTEEVKTGGTWIDGKPIYRKVVDIGTLPDTTSKSVPHNIQNLDKVLEAKLVANDNISSIVCSFGGKELSTYVNRETIFIVSGNNHTGYSGHVIIEYTKNN